MHALSFLPDLPDLDNSKPVTQSWRHWRRSPPSLVLQASDQVCCAALNLLSSFSLGGPVVLAPIAGIRKLLSFMARPGGVFPPGGHNVSGVLGQIGACLELAEQIQRGDLDALVPLHLHFMLHHSLVRCTGEVRDPDAIYLAYGSGCTTTGLVIGVAIARHLRLKAFRSPGFSIVAVVVHHAVAALHGRLGVLYWRCMPLSVSWSIDAVCAYLATMGMPDLTDFCHETRKQCLELCTDADYGGR